MKIRKGFAFRLVFLLGGIWLLLCGCTIGMVTEKQIRDDIIRFDNFKTSDLSIASYTEIARNTSKENGTDYFEIKIIADNEIMEYESNYIMWYEKTDNGWILTDVEQTDWICTAKEFPSPETVAEDAVAVFRHHEAKYSVDNIRCNVPEMADSALQTVNGKPYCVYSVTCSAENEHAHFETELMMYYAFDRYNGWHYMDSFSDIPKEPSDIKPKTEPSLDLALTTMSEYPGIAEEYVSMLEVEENVYEFAFIGIDNTTYKYLTIYYDITVTCKFDPINGWFVDCVDVEKVKTDIDATGIWSYRDDTGAQNYRFNIVSVDEETVTFEADLVVTDFVVGFGDLKNEVSTNGETLKREWVKSEQEEFVLKTDQYITFFKHTSWQYLEFRAYSGERYDESGFYYNDYKLTEES